MKKKIIPVVVAVLAVLSVLIGIVVTNDNRKPSESLTTGSVKETETAIRPSQFPYTLANGCEIVELKGLSGAFPEDGTNDIKENTAAIVVRNGTESHFQLMNIVIETDKGNLEFQLTTFFADSWMTVFEKNARTFSRDMKIKSVKLIKSVVFAVPPTVYSDIFEITVHDSVLNIKNISGSDIDGNIFIYYKSIDENSDWYGGITYRTAVSGGLKNGELRQLPASHFTKAGSKVVFVTYAE